MTAVIDSPAVRFGELARIVASEARQLGLAVPVFKSPCRIEGANRSIRRRPDGSPVVAITIAGRPWDDIIADLIAGVVHVTGNTFDDYHIEDALIRAVATHGATKPSPPSTPSKQTRESRSRSNEQ